MSLHDEILSLDPVVPEDFDPTITERSVYKIAHRDARHAAAELALKADARIAELEKLITEAPTFFAPQYDFEGRKLDWLNRAALSNQPHKGE